MNIHESIAGATPARLSRPTATQAPLVVTAVEMVGSTIGKMNTVTITVQWVKVKV
jgi:hypothetical protein